MSEDSSEPNDPRLEAVDRGLREAQARRAAEERADRERLERAQAARTAGGAWRIVIDLVVATALGGAMGYGVDQWIGSRPWGVIIGLFAGFGVAVWLAIRWAQALQRGASAPPEQGS